MAQHPELLYLDLIKKTLSFTLWPEPPIPIASPLYKQSLIKKLLLSACSKILNREFLIAAESVF